MTTGFSDVNAVISGVNLAFLSLGRFVFLPYQRDQVRVAAGRRGRAPPRRGALAQRAWLYADAPA